MAVQIACASIFSVMNFLDDVLVAQSEDLGGNDGNPPDPILLQRIANDSSADQFNSPAAYPACSTEPSCITYPGQPQGQFIYSPTAAQLGQAFLAISSQILRLSH